MFRFLLICLSFFSFIQATTGDLPKDEKWLARIAHQRHRYEKAHQKPKPQIYSEIWQPDPETQDIRVIYAPKPVAKQTKPLILPECTILRIQNTNCFNKYKIVRRNK